MNDLWPLIRGATCFLLWKFRCDACFGTGHKGDKATFNIAVARVKDFGAIHWKRLGKKMHRNDDISNEALLDRFDRTWCAESVLGHRISMEKVNWAIPSET